MSWFGSQAPDVDSDDYDPANPYGDDQFEEEEFDDQDPSADRQRGGAHRYGPLMDAFGNHYRQDGSFAQIPVRSKKRVEDSERSEVVRSHKRRKQRKKWWQL